MTVPDPCPEFVTVSRGFDQFWCDTCGWRWDYHADERERRGPAAVARFEQAVQR